MPITLSYWKMLKSGELRQQKKEPVSGAYVVEAFSRREDQHTLHWLHLHKRRVLAGHTQGASVSVAYNAHHGYDRGPGLHAQITCLLTRGYALPDSERKDH